MPPLSIIIPTRERAQILRRCLEHIERQTIRKELEVIIVIDGDDPKTVEMVSNLSWSFPLQCFAIPKSQQGVARNRGVEKAKGECCLFIGDDVFLARDACEKHLKIHASRRAGCHATVPPLDGACPELATPCSFVSAQDDTELPCRRAQGDTVAVLGHTTWDPSLEITPVMHWLEDTGWQFGYSKIEQYAHSCISQPIQHRFTYTSHLSLPTKIARRIPFREDVSLYGWEDIEWGMRLRDAGIRLFYEPDAKALHHHTMTLEESLQRMETLGISAIHLKRIAPEFDRIPTGWKLFAYHLLSLLPTMRGRHSKAFLRGIQSGKKVLLHDESPVH